MTCQWQHDEFKEKTDCMPRLPLRSESDKHEFGLDISSMFIDGVNYNDEPSNNSHVQLTRFANNDPKEELPPVLEYEISLGFGPRTCPITMSPQAAIHLGSFLIQAGTAALRDLAENSAFLAEGVQA